MRTTGAAILLAALLVSGCKNSDSTTTSPAPTTPTTTSPTTETFASILAPLGTASRTFVASASGTITATLTTAGPPSNVAVQLGLGAPNPAGPGCALTKVVTAVAGTQLTTTGDAGSYCVAILDIGNAPRAGISFTISIFHP
ncbi:MAG: hypothetical protein ABUS56_05300 [Acidobacteriota bacterium]